VQIESYSGYGCACSSEEETRLGILYDSKNKTVSFFKNNINQGIAFRNVESGLIPSIDVWFQYGSVEILKNKKPLFTYIA
jgi:hypothetical protein